MADSEHLPEPKTLGEAREIIARQHQRIETLEAEVVELKTQVTELLDRIGKSSRNSSRPPSSDSPSQRTRRRKKPRSHRRQGAQPGHDFHQRPLVPAASLDEIVRYFPPSLCPCGEKVDTAEEPVRHQVFDIPTVRFTVTEHQLFSGRCRGCGRTHAASLPDSVPRGQMGSSLIAWIALMSGQFHLSIRQIQALLHEQWSLDFSLGCISAAQEKANAAMAAPYRHIGEFVRRQCYAHADETRHWRGTELRWLWALVAGPAVYLITHYSRGKVAAESLLGSFAGVLVTDDLASYNTVEPHRHQLCWCHLARHFLAMSERVGRGGQIGGELLCISQCLSRIRHYHRDGRISDAIYHRRLERLRRRYRQSLERGARLRIDGRTRRQCRHLLTREALCWTFMAYPEVPIQNNAAERALRPYVIMRKLSFATQSYRGDQFRPMVLSIVQSARGLGISTYGFLKIICREYQQHGHVTSRLPLDAPALIE